MVHLVLGNAALDHPAGLGVRGVEHLHLVDRGRDRLSLGVVLAADRVELTPHHCKPTVCARAEMSSSAPTAERKLYKLRFGSNPTGPGVVVKFSYGQL